MLVSVVCVLMCLTACEGRKQSYSIPVKYLKSVQNRNLTLDSNVLSQLDISADDMLNATGTADDKGTIFELDINGRKLPVEIKQQMIVEKEIVQEFKEEDNGYRYEDMKYDVSLVPVQYKVHWKENHERTSTSVTSAVVSINRNNLSITISHGDKRYINFYKEAWQNKTDDIKESKYSDCAGLTLRVINLHTLEVTREMTAKMEQFLGVMEICEIVKILRPGRLVILTSLLDITSSMNEQERECLHNEGSKLIKFLKFADIWMWVFVSGGPTIIETVVQASISKDKIKKYSNLKSQLALQHVALKKTDIFCNSWPNTETFHKRRIFCDSYDGYPHICSCDTLYHVEQRSKYEHQGSDISILVTTKARPLYLFRLLSTLLSQDGVNKHNILVCVDGSDSVETLKLLELLDMKYLIHDPEGSSPTARISRHYRFTLYSGLKLFRDIKKFIILEDDLILSKSFYSYMKQVSSVLDEDETVYAVSAYNVQAYAHTASNLSKLYRDDSHPSYGWLTSRDFITEILPKWTSPTSIADWDFWMGSPLIRRGRSVVVPEVPRVRHGGISGGIHVRGTESAILLVDKPHTDRDVTLDIHSVLNRNYEEDTKNLLRIATQLKIKNGRDVEPVNWASKDVLSICVSAVDERDEWAFRILAYDLEIWSKDMRGIRNGVLKLPIHNSTLLIVTCPHSIYSGFCNEKFGQIEATRKEAEYLTQIQNNGLEFEYSGHREEDWTQIFT